MTMKLYFTGAAIWVVTLAHVAGFNLSDHIEMLNLAGQPLGF